MAKNVLWSAMKGRVVLNGQPAPGAVLVRETKWHWTNEKIVDKTVANAAGDFELPTIERSSLLGSILPHEPVVEQFMSIEYQGKTYDAWGYFKRDYTLNGENNGAPIVVTCRLGSEPVVRGKLTSICEFH